MSKGSVQVGSSCFAQPVCMGQGGAEGAVVCLPRLGSITDDSPVSVAFQRVQEASKSPVRSSLTSQLSACSLMLKTGKFPHARVRLPFCILDADLVGSSWWVLFWEPCSIRAKLDITQNSAKQGEWTPLVNFLVKIALISWINFLKEKIIRACG